MTTTRPASSNILTTAQYNFEQATRRLNLGRAITRKLEGPLERIEMSANPALSDGALANVKTFIVRHNDSMGPSKGGIRMSLDVTLDDVAGLAMEMTWKTSLIGVPFGGGKAGIVANAQTLSPQNKEIIIRAFTRHARRHIGPELYVPAPDMGTNERDMGHIRDCISYSDGTSITHGCFVTGKPVILGGIVGRREATGKGVVATIRAACDKRGLALSGARVAVQGLGNVGLVAAQDIARYGARVVAVEDISGAVARAEGLNMNHLTEHLAANVSLAGYPEGSSISREEFLAWDCDILIPAAAAAQITADNADSIRAVIVAEGANAPTTPEADDILASRDVFVIPDILCNAGGVFVSYLEYTQETQREQMTIEEVEARLFNRMQTRFADVYRYGENRRVPMRHAAMDMAVQKVVDAIEARGLLP